MIGLMIGLPLPLAQPLLMKHIVNLRCYPWIFQTLLCHKFRNGVEGNPQNLYKHITLKVTGLIMCRRIIGNAFMCCWSTRSCRSTCCMTLTVFLSFKEEAPRIYSRSPQQHRILQGDAMIFSPCSSEKNRTLRIRWLFCQHQCNCLSSRRLRPQQCNLPLLRIAMLKENKTLSGCQLLGMKMAQSLQASTPHCVTGKLDCKETSQRRCLSGNLIAAFWGSRWSFCHQVKWKHRRLGNAWNFKQVMTGW